MLDLEPIKARVEAIISVPRRTYPRDIAVIDILALVAEVDKLYSLLFAVLAEQVCGEPDRVISPELEKAIHNALQ